MPSEEIPLCSVPALRRGLRPLHSFLLSPQNLRFCGGPGFLPAEKERMRRARWKREKDGGCITGTRLGCGVHVRMSPPAAGCGRGLGGRRMDCPSLSAGAPPALLRPPQGKPPFERGWHGVSRDGGLLYKLPSIANPTIAFASSKRQTPLPVSAVNRPHPRLRFHHQRSNRSTLESPKILPASC